MNFCPKINGEMIGSGAQLHGQVEYIDHIFDTDCVIADNAILLFRMVDLDEFYILF